MNLIHIIYRCAEIGISINFMPYIYSVVGIGNNQVPKSVNLMIWLIFLSFRYVLQTFRYVLQTFQYVLQTFRYVLQTFRYVLQTLQYVLQPFRYVLQTLRYVLQTLRYVLGTRKLLKELYREDLKSHIDIALQLLFIGQMNDRLPNI